MSEEKYRVVLNGFAKNQSKGEYFVEEEFAKLFKIEQAEAKQLLRTAPNTLKENLELDVAVKMKEAIENIGCDCEVQNMKHQFSGLELELQ